MRVEYLGNNTEEDVNLRTKKVAAAGKISRTSGKAHEVYESCVDPLKNGKFAKRVIDMGHCSIAEHDYVSVAIDDVTPILEHILIGSRLASFTVKSRREVDFRTNGFYVPEFRDNDGNIHKDNEKLKSMYTEHMQKLFDFYGELVDSGMKLENARFVLPYCFNSNLIMGMDANSFTKLTRYLLYGKVSKIKEAHDLGEEFLKIIDEKIPYMSDKVRKETKDGSDNLEFLDSYVDSKQLENVDIHDTVKLVSYTENPDVAVLTSAIQQRYQVSFEKAKEILDRCTKDDPEFGNKLIKAILDNPEQRELEQANFRFDFPIPLAVRTHLERHRMQSLLTPDFVPLWDLKNYDVPPTINEEQKAKYDELFKENRKLRDYFKEQGVNDNDLVYFYQAANKCNVLTNMNGRSLTWISRMRCCNKAQPAIRKIANGMCDEVRRVAPVVGSGLGATCDVFGYCPEGRESCGKVLKKQLDTKKEGK